LWSRGVEEAIWSASASSAGRPLLVKAIVTRGSPGTRHLLASEAVLAIERVRPLSIFDRFIIVSWTFDLGTRAKDMPSVQDYLNISTWSSPRQTGQAAD
jgi:hypothetical protein